MVMGFLIGGCVRCYVRLEGEVIREGCKEGWRNSLVKRYRGIYKKYSMFGNRK